MEIFARKPIKVIPYLLGFQMRKDRKKLAEKVLARYFDPTKPYDEQLSAIEHVSLVPIIIDDFFIKEKILIDIDVFTLFNQSRGG